MGGSRQTYPKVKYWACQMVNVPWRKKKGKGIPTAGVWVVPGPPTHSVISIEEEWLRSEIRVIRESVLPWYWQWSNWNVLKGELMKVLPGKSHVLGSTFTLPEQTVSLGDIDYFVIFFISSLKPILVPTVPSVRIYLVNTKMIQTS